MKHIHFIGICGVAMSAIAIAFHKKGYKVTGSDAGFFPPVSTHLKNAGVEFYPGWHVEKMTKDTNPDLVIVGNVASSTNPEWLFVQKNNIPYLSYPEALAKYFIKKKSIVCAGTYGKSTTSTLLSWILKNSGLDPSYMFGSLAVNDFESAKIGNGDWSVVEGDEYKSARWDNRPKFAHYSPTHLLLTSVVWDHADVYPTEELYFEEFKKLVGRIPNNGLVVISENVDEKIVKLSNCKTVEYGKKTDNDYWYSQIEQTQEGLLFNIHNQNNTYKINCPIFGEYNAENICGCFAMAHSIGIEPEKIISSISKFKGMKRRLEKRYSGDITVIDDIAHSPTKAKPTLENLRKIYSGKIIAIFESNTGNRQTASIPGYDHAFDNADLVIIPELTKIKTDKNISDQPLDGKQLTKVISQTHKNTIYMEQDAKLIEFLTDNTEKGDVIAFLGSHGFRGMIEILVEIFTKKEKTQNH